MNIVPSFLVRRARPAFQGDRFWAERIPAMKLEESMATIEDEVGAAVRGQYHPRDLDEGRPLQVPPTPDLFADGIEIAQAVLDWEVRAGQSIISLIEHLKAERELRKTVTAKAMTAPDPETTP